MGAMCSEVEQLQQELTKFTHHLSPFGINFTTEPACFDVLMSLELRSMPNAREIFVVGHEHQGKSQTVTFAAING
jgi:hypothetical protein